MTSKNKESFLKLLEEQNKMIKEHNFKDLLPLSKKLYRAFEKVDFSDLSDSEKSSIRRISKRNSELLNAASRGFLSAKETYEAYDNRESIFTTYSRPKCTP